MILLDIESVLQALYLFFVTFLNFKNVSGQTSRFRNQTDKAQG